MDIVKTAALGIIIGSLFALTGTLSSNLSAIHYDLLRIEKLLKENQK